MVKGTAMAELHVIISDDLVNELRMRVLQLYGSEKGALSKAVAEAIRLWLKQKEAPPRKK